MRLRDLPLGSLRTFAVVADCGSITSAAETLGVTHSAVSQQIRGLEEQLGFALFDRRGRRVVLNPAGKALLGSVQNALAQLDDGVQAAAAAASGTTQWLRVTVLPSFAQRWLLRLVPGHPVATRAVITLRPRHGMKMTAERITENADNL